MAIYYKGRNVGNMIVNLPSLANVSEKKIYFEDWHNGTSEETLVAFSHNLGAMPDYVAIYADTLNWLSILKNYDYETPDFSAVILSAERYYDKSTDTYLPPSYRRETMQRVVNVATSTADYALISHWDEKYVYVNSAAASFYWLPKDFTNYTMICGRIREANATPSIPADTIVDNGICTIEAIDLSFDDWLGAADYETREITHNLGVKPDMIVILPSTRDFNAEYIDFSPVTMGCFVTTLTRIMATVPEIEGFYTPQTAEMFFGEEGAYIIKLNDGKVYDGICEGVYGCDENKVTIMGGGEYVFAPRDVITYKMLVIKHT